MKALFSWLKERGAGVLVHPTCFPSKEGVGVLNGEVVRFLDFLQGAEIGFWQVCPLGPTGFGDSPYQCFSASAGNPYLIDLEALVEAGLLAREDLKGLEELPRERVEFGWLYERKWPVLWRAFENFKERGVAEVGAGISAKGFEAFRSRQAGWLGAFGLFMALKDFFGGKAWWEWPVECRFFAEARKSKAAKDAEVLRRAEGHAFFQYLFFTQWGKILKAARERGVKVIGDVPIFVARDSVEVWAKPELFLVDGKTGAPKGVAGVPPDYFSEDGQLWGNPLYDWAAHKKEGFAWWIGRLKQCGELFDAVRVDHFRAFDTYWEIPAGAKTAREGVWKKGPGLEFFEAVKKALPGCRLIAEDLGDLLPSVRELLEATGLPGMGVLQFAFGSGAENAYLPHNLQANSVLYPGTHDNTTALDWYAGASERERDFARRYLRVSGEEIGWDFVRAGYASVSRLVVVPLQDLLCLGKEGRFNTPGTSMGNWQWRFSSGQLDGLMQGGMGYLRELGRVYGRGGGK